MTQTELAQRTGLSTKTINLIISGKEPVSQETALSLEKVFKVPARFWLNLESRYRESLAREQEEKRLEGHTDWAREFPYPAMAKRGLVPATAKATEKVMHLQKYFAVRNSDQWSEVYHSSELALSYRKCAKATEKSAALSAWLREGEILADKVEVGPFDKALFAKNLKKARAFTLLDPSDFLDQLVQLCAEAGVIYQLVPEYPGLGISGVMRWYRGRPVIQQTLRFKTNDSFWFTFFHEGRHVLQVSKTKMFLEGSNATQEDQTREDDADKYARDLLIPPSAWSKFVASNKSPSWAEIREFADEIGVHPAIVVGRAFREKVLAYGHPAQRMQVKFVWSQP
jgi:addiction module HigA family antidote